MVRAAQSVADLLEPAGEQHAIEQLGKSQEYQLASALQGFPGFRKAPEQAVHLQCAQHTQQVRKKP